MANSHSTRFVLESLPARSVLDARLEAERQRIWQAQGVVRLASMAAKDIEEDASEFDRERFANGAWTALEGVDELLESVTGALEPDVVFKSDGGWEQAPADEQPQPPATDEPAPATALRDTLYSLHTALGDEICALRCAYNVIDTAENTGSSDDLSAARNLLSHSLARLAQIANDLDLVDVRNRLTPKGGAQS